MFRCPRCTMPITDPAYCPRCVERRTHDNPVDKVKQFHIATNLGQDPTFHVVPQFAEFFALPPGSTFFTYQVAIPADYCLYDLSVIGLPEVVDEEGVVTDIGGALLVIGNNPAIEIDADRPYNLDRKSFPCFVGVTYIYIFPRVMPAEITAVDIIWTIIYGDK